MNTFIWLIAATAAAWSACSVLHLRVVCGLTIFAIIGSVGALFGGHALAPGNALSAVAFGAPIAVLLACVLGIGSLQLVCAVHRHFIGPRCP